MAQSFNLTIYILKLTFKYIITIYKPFEVLLKFVSLKSVIFATNRMAVYSYALGYRKPDERVLI